MKSIITWVLFCLFLAIVCWQNGYIMGMNNGYKHIERINKELREEVIGLSGRIIAVETIQKRRGK